MSEMEAERPIEDSKASSVPTAERGAEQGSLLAGEPYGVMRQRRGSRRWAVAAWVAIALGAAAIIGLHGVGERAALGAGPQEPKAGDQAPVELVARALVGVKQWDAGSGSSEQLALQLEPAARQQVDPATTPAGDLVRFATLAGEMAGAEAALDLLDAAEAQFEGATKAKAGREHLAALFAAQDELSGPITPRADTLDRLSAQREALRALHTTAPPDGEAVDDSAYADGIRQDIRMLRRIYMDAGPADVASDEQARLVERHGYFGRLALAFGQGEGAAQRDWVHAKSAQTFRVVFAAVALIVTAMLSGFVLFVVALVLLARGRVTRRLGWQIQELKTRHHAFVETMAIFLWCFVGVTLVASLLHDAMQIDLSHVLIWLLLPVALWPLARGVRGRELAMGLGWHANGKGAAGVGKEMVCGVVGYLAGLPIFVLGIVLTFLLLLIPGTHAEHPVTQEIDSSLWGYLRLLMLASLWAPLVEETMFRGALLTHARSWMPSVAAAALVGFLFAAIHPQGWAAIPALMSLGVIFALIREWRGSLIGSMTVHALHNGFLITMLTLAVG